jgi:hypothetical protein
LALLEDARRLLENPELLASALAAACTGDNQAVPLETIKRKLVKSLQSGFVDRLSEALAIGDIPPGIGRLRIKKKLHLFLLRDVAAAIDRTDGSVDTPHLSASSHRHVDTRRLPVPIDFSARFDDVFARLDRARGGHNLVSLVTLRQALAVDRAMFDAGLERLRRDGRYVLSAAEGRHGISDEERAAGVLEEGTLLLYVARRV